MDNTISRSNYELVKKVKNDNPNSYIIYKPHPDVEAGLRLKGSKERLIKNMVNSVVKNNSLEDLFEQVDRVAVLTSLGGFEALIRGIPVSTYGSPFYSGWGLTDDKFHSESLQFITVHSDTFRFVSIHYDSFGFVLIHSASIIFVLILSDSSQFVQIHSDLFRFV